jgi:hypothetical protein
LLLFLTYVYHDARFTECKTIYALYSTFLWNTGKHKGNWTYKLLKAFFPRHHNLT